MLRTKSTKLMDTAENGCGNDGDLVKNKSKTCIKAEKPTISKGSLAVSSYKSPNVASRINSKREISSADSKRRPMLRSSKTTLSMDLNNATVKSDVKLNSTRSFGSKLSRKINETSATKHIGSSSLATHKPGELPKYLQQRNKSIGVSLVESSLITTSRKSFLTIKSRLADAQADFLKTYSSLKDLEKKHSKAILPPEDYQLIVCVEGEEGKLVLKPDAKASSIFLRPSIDLEKGINLENREYPKIAEGFDEYHIKMLADKIRSVMEGYYKICRDLLKHPEGQMGDSSGIDSVESKLIKSIEERVSEEYLKTNHKISKAMEEFENFHRDNKTLNEVNDKRIDFECKMSELKSQIEALRSRNDSLEKQTLKRSESTVNSKDYHKQIQELQNKCSDKDKDIARYKSYDKRHEEQKSKLLKDNKALSEELSLKGNRMSTMERELDHYKNCSEKNEQLMRELTAQKESFCSLLQIEKDLRRRLDEESTWARTLKIQVQQKEDELANCLRNLENQKSSLLASGDQQQASLKNEIKTLHKKLEELENCKRRLQHDNDDLRDTLDLGQMDELKTQLDMTLKEIQLLKTTNATLCDRLSLMDTRLKERNAIIAELESKMSNPEYIQNCTKEVYEEMNKLRNSELEKVREINKLKMEVSKINLELKQHEETNFTNKRLLKIRSDLIDSIQEKEASTNCRIEELYTEVVHKDGIISHINHELNAKSEEMANLISTLNHKTQELTRQEHTTMMLKENVAINQKMRERQVERIANLEEQVVDLKETLEVYQENVIAGNSIRREIIFGPENEKSECSTNEETILNYSSSDERFSDNYNIKKVAK